MEALYLFETSGATRPATQRHITEDPNYDERLVISYRLETVIFSSVYKTYIYTGNETFLIRR